MKLRPSRSATITQLAGLLEQVANKPSDRADIYRLAEELGVDSDHLLRLTEAAELLGFATITGGDIALTPLGETFAEASILARKEIVATRIRRLPLFRWLLSMLRASREKRLERGVAQTALELDFPAEAAERQLETIIDWGRYSELVAYDDTRDSFYLEPAGEAPLPAAHGSAERP